MKITHLLFAAVMAFSSAGYAVTSGWTDTEKSAPTIFSKTPDIKAFCTSVSGLNYTTGMSGTQAVLITAFCGTATGAQPTYVSMARERSSMKDTSGQDGMQIWGMALANNRSDLVPILCSTLTMSSLSGARYLQTIIGC